MKTIKDYLESSWHEIVAQGGKFEKDFEDNYLVFGLWILCQDKWLEISSIEVTDNEFQLICYILDNSPIPESSKFNRPPRQLVKKFPNDLRIDLFIQAETKRVELRELQYKEQEMILRDDLKIILPLGDIFKISISEKCPGCLELDYFSS